ncbi:NAD(P)/FAD-dependent oxidoreductase [Pararhodospirillum oryzae]|uniref:NAD/FAD-binding protein n=1 Tax=Pararhodospirillum oryzae TaxID=478448 RepID=A0A512H953_9PROT|nr:FAD-dependent oxidoreductase [Pararhodospirillum oryzae]GEO81974.1 NAD/FAD-binding protein [Pararhodospirillum oryzae]
MTSSPSADRASGRLSVAVIGSGIAGLSAAWLLSQRHDVTLLEKEPRIGGHAHTVDVRPDGAAPVAVDTGVMLHNDRYYPNFVALLDHLGVATRPVPASFAVSIDGGHLEYASRGLSGLLAQPGNLLRPRFWSVLTGALRFYQQAPALMADPAMAGRSLGQWLAQSGYARPFIEDYLVPLAAALWSSPAQAVEERPALALLRALQTHGLFEWRRRVAWRTVVGGARVYLDALATPVVGNMKLRVPVRRLIRCASGVLVEDHSGAQHLFDKVVVATHPDQALALLDEPTPDEQRVLGAFAARTTEVWLHQDLSQMPRRPSAWAAWNTLVERRLSREGLATVTYWMNELQGIDRSHPLFVTLNPALRPEAETVLGRATYRHPVFSAEALAAQGDLWKLQDQGGIWYAGAWFGAGFHEDALQAGLLVAESLGGGRRPWHIPNENARLAVAGVPAA